MSQCQLCKHRNRTYEGPYCTVVPKGRGDIVYVDTLGPIIKGKRGCAYVLVIVDAFSKHIRMFELRNAKTGSCLNSRKQRIILDHGTQFNNERWRKTLMDAGVEVNYTSVRHPQSNASERYMRVVGDLLRIKCFEHHNSWVNRLKEIEGYINRSFSSVTGYIPEDIQRGTMGKLPFETVVKFPNAPGGWDMSGICKEIQERIKKHGDKKKNQKNKNYIFEEGDLVLQKNLMISNQMKGVCSKLSPIYDGPYTVVK